MNQILNPAPSQRQSEVPRSGTVKSDEIVYSCVVLTSPALGLSNFYKQKLSGERKSKIAQNPKSQDSPSPPLSSGGALISPEPMHTGQTVIGAEAGTRKEPILKARVLGRTRGGEKTPVPAG